MQTRVDLIEQKNPTESEGCHRRTDQTEPGLGSGGFVLEIENDRFTFSAVNQTKVAPRSPRVPRLFFGYHQIVDSRICEAKQSSGQGLDR